MIDERRRWLALGLGAIALALFVYGLTLEVESESLFIELIGLTAFISPSMAGCYLAYRLPNNPVGWILVGFGITFTLGVIGETIAMTDHPLASWGAWLGAWQWSVSAALILVQLPMRFPEGNLPSAGYRWVTPASIFGVALVILGNAFMSSVTDPTGGGELVVQLPLDIGFPPELGNALSQIGTVILLATVVAALTASVRRFRGSEGAVRQQMKVFASALVLAVIALVATLLLYEVGAILVANAVSVLLVIFLVSSIVLAVVRYRLYDFDRLVSRTVSYTLIAGALAAIYAFGAVWLPSRLVGGQTPLFVAGSTLAVAALFNPLRRRVMAWVDRRFNRSRYDLEQTVEEFGRRLRDQTDADQLAGDWAEVVTGTLEPSSVGVWVRKT